MTNKREERDWLAFLYVAGELSAKDAGEFEECLADDQEAREAVVRAVELAETTLIAQTQIGQIRSDRDLAPRVAVVSSVVWGRRLAWMACGAVACFALILLRPATVVRVASLSDWSGTSLPFPTSLSPELARTWAETRDSRDPGETLDSVSALVVPATVDHEIFDDSISTPSWMLTAVQGLSLTAETLE